MRKRPDSCIGCPCYEMGSDFSAVTGTGVNGVMIVAEASGAHEAREQRPLVEWAPSGSILERTLNRMGLDRAQFSTTNCIRCRPRRDWLENAPWEYAALRQCRPNLDAAIASRRPRAILALGGIATRELTGLAGDKLGVSHLCGYVLRGPHNIPVIPTFHPAFMRRGKISYVGVFARCIQKAINVAAGKDTLWDWDTPEEVKRATSDWINNSPDFMQEAVVPYAGSRYRYLTHPSLEDAKSFYLRAKENGGLTICYDLETGESASLDEDARDGFTDTRIRLIQFSLGAGEGIAFPWHEDFRYIASDILQLPNIKVGHNVWIFDNKILRTVGEREGLRLLPRGTVHDTLQMFHHWQPDLPAHLQFCSQWINFPFPWKHLDVTNTPFYGCVDVDSNIQLYNFLLNALKKDAIWGDEVTTGYTGQVLRVRPVLAAMEDRGLPVDDEERLKLDGEFKKAGEELLQELWPRFPDECQKLQVYKTPPPTPPPQLKSLTEAERMDGRLWQEPDKTDDKGNVKAGHWYRYGLREVPVDLDGEGRELKALRWCRIYEFNPNSKDMLIDYMKAKGHVVPKSKEEDREGNRKDTTIKSELLRLAHRYSDNFYNKTIDYRELTKMRGTYIDGFKPHLDGCVHTTFTFDTAIGQLSSRNPNIQNFPKHARLAKATRRMIKAKPGHILTEWDYKSCHVLTLGYLANDKDYIRCARIDMHSLVTGHKLGLWDLREILRMETDEQLKARCKWLKQNEEWKHIRDARMKHAILGIGNGLKKRGLFEKHMEDFSGEKEAGEFLDVIESLFPKEFAWHSQVQQLAHDKKELKTEFGFIRRFYEVFRWDYRKGAWGHGDQAEMAISYWLSNIAFGHIREGLKAVHYSGLAERYGLCNNVHDSLLFHFPERLLKQHVQEIYPVLSAKSLVLHGPAAPQGLWIDVECNAGYNWSEMEEVNVRENYSADGRDGQAGTQGRSLVGSV